MGVYLLDGKMFCLNQIVKWILYNNVEWKRLWGKRSEPYQPHQRLVSSKEGDVVYMVGLEGSCL